MVFLLYVKFGEDSIIMKFVFEVFDNCFLGDFIFFYELVWYFKVYVGFDYVWFKFFFVYSVEFWFWLNNKG